MSTSLDIVQASKNLVFFKCQQRSSLGQDSQPLGQAPIYVPDGLVCYALSLADDGGVCLRRFHAFRVAIGEFRLAAILYVLYPEDDS